MTDDRHDPTSLHTYRPPEQFERWTQEDLETSEYGRTWPRGAAILLGIIGGGILWGLLILYVVWTYS